MALLLKQGLLVNRLLSQQFGDRVLIFRFRGEQGLLISHQWISGCGDCEMQSVLSTNFIRFERWHQNCDSREFYCHSECCSAIHHLPHAKCHRLSRRSSKTFVKHSKILHFMLLLCPSWLFSVSACLAPVIFVLQLPFECYLGFFTMEISFQYKNWMLSFEIFGIFLL